jgi:2-(1,2-epoxy-1,2-dihydrophenyl)acetyl-CoA isomerase
MIGAGRHVLTIDSFDKPMVAAIGGAAAGGGLSLVLLHDVRFASEKAVFTVAFTRIGLSLEMGLSYLLPRAIGPQAAFDLAVTSRRVKSEEALALGIVWRVVPDHDLASTAIAYAHSLAERSPLAVQISKRLLRRTWDHTFRQQLETEWPWQVAAYDSPEAKEAIAAFLQRSGD